MDDLEERELSLRRKRSFRLVQNVEPLLKAIGEQRDERLAVGLLVLLTHFSDDGIVVGMTEGQDSHRKGVHMTQLA